MNIDNKQTHLSSLCLTSLPDFILITRRLGKKSSQNFHFLQTLAGYAHADHLARGIEKCMAGPKSTPNDKR